MPLDFKHLTLSYYIVSVFFNSPVRVCCPYCHPILALFWSLKVRTWCLSCTYIVCWIPFLLSYDSASLTVVLVAPPKTFFMFCMFFCSVLDFYKIKFSMCHFKARKKKLFVEVGHLYCNMLKMNHFSIDSCKLDLSIWL